MQILVTVLHLSVVSYLLGHSPALFSLPTEWRYTQPQPGFVPKPQTRMASCLLDASTRMLSGAHMPHVQILVLLSASLTIRWPKVQSKGSSNGGMGYSEGSTRLWEPRKALSLLWQLEKASWVECLGELFSGVFENKEKFTSQKGHREHCN